MIKVLLFAGLAETADCSKVQFHVESLTISELKKRMIQRFPMIEEKLSRSLIAVNKKHASELTVVMPGDEVAFVPPVSGG